MNDIGEIKFIGPQRAKLLLKMGIENSYDFLYHFPRSYEDRTTFKKISEIMPGETACIVATVGKELKLSRIRGSLSISKGKIFDETGNMDLTFFNQIFLKSRLKEGQTFIFYGKVTGNLVKKEIVNPDFQDFNEQIINNGQILPIYPLVAGLSQKLLRKAMNQTLSDYIIGIKDPLPDWIINDYDLCQLKFAIKNIHFPSDFKSQIIAKKRLIFDELFFLLTGMQLIIDKQKRVTSCVFDKFVDMNTFYNSLEFELTDAQKRAINQCINDLNSKNAMNRLLQGDVGSGKTVVAAALIYYCVKNNYQAAFMVPTEILANQHFEALNKMFKNFNIDITLLTGSLSAVKRKEIKDKIKNSQTQVIIGTHAIISNDVIFKNLGLCIVDEQHRFGVQQRASLNEKGENPHILVMSATPIPRTLALILYSDLDISIIDTMPENRKKVDTFLVDDSMNQRIYNFVKKQAQMGFLTYFVCPIIEGQEDSDLSSVLEFSQQLEKKYLKGLKIGVMHGKMSTDEKTEIMRRFEKGDLQVLVSTTVIEVGINIANATLMIIKDAQQFGLSQLHQLRGRVGRSHHKSYCILHCNSKNPTTLQRLKTLTKTNDGFKIANSDLEFRGPGEFLGNRQHGLPLLKIANLATDIQTLNMAKEASERIVSQDPSLEKSENLLLKNKINKLFFDINNKNIFN